MIEENNVEAPRYFIISYALTSVLSNPTSFGNYAVKIEGQKCNYPNRCEVERQIKYAFKASTRMDLIGITILNIWEVLAEEYEVFNHE